MPSPMVTTEILPIGPTNPDGKYYGNSASDPIGFHGAAPTTQQTNPMQAAVPSGASGFGNASANAAIYTSTQSPSAVANATAAEQSVTVTGVLATDLVMVNKPTSQAGLAVCLGRVSAANTVKLSFGNPTAATITPTGSEAYLVMTLGANLQVSATLSPAAVAANAVSEQQFTLTGASVGLAPGMILSANKPTQQAGLGVMYARVVSNNTVAICFANFTGSTITPTASESYIFSGLNALVPTSNLINLGVNGGTLSAVANATAAEQSVTEASILATDVWVGGQKPTTQAGLAFVNGRVSAASTLKFTFSNSTAATVTPTGSELYSITIYRQAPAALLSIFTATISPASVAATTAAEQTFAVTGIVSGQPIIAMPQFNFTTAGAVAPAGMRASATNQIALNFVNLSSSAITPPSGSWTIAMFNHTTPTAGNNVNLAVTPLAYSLANLVGAMRSMAVSKGLMLGS